MLRDAFAKLSLRVTIADTFTAPPPPHRLWRIIWTAPEVEIFIGGPSTVKLERMTDRPI